MNVQEDLGPPTTTTTPLSSTRTCSPGKLFLPLKERPQARWLGHLQLSLQVRARAHGPTDGHLLCQPRALGLVTALQRAHPGHSLHSLSPCNTATWWPALHCPARSPFRGFRTQDPPSKVGFLFITEPNSSAYIDFTCKAFKSQKALFRKQLGCAYVHTKARKLNV